MAKRNRGSGRVRETMRMSREAAGWAEAAIESDAEASRLRAERDALVLRLAEAESRRALLAARASQGAPAPAPAEEALSLVDPCDPASYLRAVEAAFPDRVAVLPEALESAAALERFDPSETWRMALSLATVLWPLAFSGQKADARLSAMYQARAGFELSRGENGATNRNGRLARLRERGYMGRTVDVSMHVKGGTRRNPVRIYLAIDRPSGKVVVGDMTAHLETAGSARKGHKR